MTNSMWQCFGLDIINIDVYAKFDQTVPNGLRAMGNIRKLLRTDIQTDHEQITQNVIEQELSSLLMTLLFDTLSPPVKFH